MLISRIFTVRCLVILALLFVQQKANAKDRDSSDFGPMPGPPPIPVTTTMNLEGYRIREYRGIVRGVTVRQPTMEQNFKANLKSIVGGRISPYMRMCETARQQAFDMLVERAQAMGANAVVGMRYDSSAFGQNDDMGTEVVCYGTAVVVEPIKEDTRQATEFKRLPVRMSDSQD